MVVLRKLAAAAILAATVNGAPFIGRLLEREEQLLESYDYVIVGGGTAGLTVANRLTEDPEITVLVLESGLPDHKDCAAILQRCLGDTMFTVFDWNITTLPNDALTGTNKQQHLTIGKALGGSSMLNGMMFDRPAPADIDAWGALGNEGWTWDELLPYYKKSETFTPPSAEQIAEFGITWDPEVHGDSGYCQSSYPHFIYPQNKNYQEAMMSLGIAQSNDQAGSAIGVFWSPFYDPFVGRENLHVITSRHVTKLLTESADGSVTITGVEYVSSDAPNATYTATATKEYILSAGTVHDPQILQLSGIGPKDVLESAGIPVVLDLPGVGNNLQDHPYTNLALHLDNVEFSVIDLDQNATLDAEQKALYYDNRTGAWTYGAPTSVAFLPLSNYSDNASAFLAAYATQNTTDFLIQGLDSTVTAGFAKQREVLLDALATTSMAAMEFIWFSGANRAVQMPFSLSIMHPFSRGYIKINSTSPFDPPVVSLRTGSNPVDLSIFPDAFRFGRKVVATPAIQALEPTELQPGLNVTSDEALVDYAANTLSTMFHPAGTSSMQPLEHGGVVDPQLRVHNVSNLRIVDASIIPLIVASHLQTTVYAIAEKASDMIKAAR